MTSAHVFSCSKCCTFYSALLLFIGLIDNELEITFIYRFGYVFMRLADFDMINGKYAIVISRSIFSDQFTFSIFPFIPSDEDFL